MQVTIHIKKANNDPMHHRDCIRLRFDGRSCYIEDEGRFQRLTRKKIALDSHFVLDLDAQEQTTPEAPTINRPPVITQEKSSSDPLAFLFNSSLLIHQSKDYSHLLTSQS